MEQLFRTYKLCAVFRDTPQEYFPITCRLPMTVVCGFLK